MNKIFLKKNTGFTPPPQRVLLFKTEMKWNVEDSLRKTIIPRNKVGGFTLIEIIVAVSIFSVISLISVDIFTSVLQGQRKIFGMQSIHENGYYIMEKMSKEIRMSAINSENELFSNSLNITNDKGNVNYIFSNDGRLLRGSEPLNSNQVQITGSFYVQKNNDIAPRVTIILNMRNKSDKIEGRAKINLQTTISSRSF